MFNACLSSGRYPKIWTDGYITPIHEAKDIANLNNYRGITVTSTINKVFNSILNTRLDDFLCKNNIINNCQIGFT